MPTPSHEKQPGRDEGKEKEAATSPGCSLTLVRPAVKAQSGASPLPGDPLTANPEATEGVPCLSPREKRPRGPHALFSLQMRCFKPVACVCW